VRDPALVIEACRKFPGKVAVGIDAKGGKVAVEGWAEASELGIIELAKSSRAPASPRSSIPTSTATAF
jgi:phosphoribosylformimino-5-aminoimidazole carboxamide ribotide isomerase